MERKIIGHRFPSSRSLGKEVLPKVASILVDRYLGRLRMTWSLASLRVPAVSVAGPKHSQRHLRRSSCLQSPVAYDDNLI